MTIIELVQKYEDDIQMYRSNTYNETQLRTDFLDDFFSLLGWDINNSANLPTNSREVLVEEALRSGSETAKRPDYTFRLFSERKFFVEAKKPSVRIQENNSAAKQTRRYGFTARLKISVLTNFEYLAIYECSEQVNASDEYDKFRIKLYHYTEYAEYFDEIKELLGKENVYNGRFDTTWEHIEDKIRQFGVDKLFLDQINEWKVTLGRQIYSFDNNIDEVNLNDIVQKYINSIVFLRVCEDRNLEVYETLLNLAEEESIQRLKDLFIEADRKYNSGLFLYDYTDNIIDNTGSVFWDIIRQLYYPESTYSFSVFSSDILGNIYELFLTKKLFIENDEVNLREQIEYRDRSIVTTPVNIIKDILKETVQKYCHDKNDEEILNSKFADIACGSGAFLLETFQLLNDILIDYYLEHDRSQLEQISENTYKLPFLIKKRLLTNCIFGVDKDLNAVEACKFGLLLKLLEYENNDSITIPSALPNLSNIEWGNSLIDFNSEGLTDTDIPSINPYTFTNQFNVIVGNPPYMNIEDITSLLEIEKPLYQSNYTTAFQQYDKYFLFIEKAFSLLSQNGLLGYIVPSKFYKVKAGKKLREFLVENNCINKIVSFGWHQMFSNKTTYTCLLILQKTNINSLNFLEVDNLINWKTNIYTEDDFTSINYNQLNSNNWILVSGRYRGIYNKLINNTSLLSNLIESKKNVFNGIQTSKNKIYIHKYIREDSNFYYITYDDREWKIEKELTRPYYETVRGNVPEEEKFFTYRKLKPNAIVIYPYFINASSEIELIDITTLRNSYPETYSFLNTYKDDLENRSMDEVSDPEEKWYRFGRNQNLDRCEVDAKIIVGVNSQSNKYVIDTSRTLVTSGGTAGYCLITVPSTSNYSIYYIQAILNSKYLEWIASLHGEVFRGGFIARGTKVLQNLPIKNIDFENTAERDAHNNIVSLQIKLISLQEQIDSNRGNTRSLTVLQRQFGHKKSELDNKIKELYNLDDNEDNLVPVIGDLYEFN